MLTVAALIEAFWQLFGDLTRCLVFTVMDACEWCAKWTR